MNKKSNIQNPSLTRKIPVVIQIIPSLGAGGAEQGCIDVAAELVKSGAKSIVVSNGGYRIPEILRGGSIHIDLPVHSKNPLIMALNILRLRKIIRDYDVDIVHARSRAPAWSALKAVEGTKARFMTTCHAPFNISGDVKKFYNSSIARGERVIAISNYVREYLLKNYEISDSVIRVIHRGVATEKFNPAAVTPAAMIKLSNEWRIPDGSQIVMMPGRLTRWKGHLVLIEAIAKLNREDIFCVMVGDDQGRIEYRAEVESAIKERGLEGRVRLIGQCNDMPAAYMMANVIVSASIEPEGFGRIPIEAQAMGRAVIATNHGGAMETIIDGVTGWLVPHSDAGALANAIAFALSMPQQARDEMAARAMYHVNENFTKTRMAEQTMDVYAELLSEKFLASPVKKPMMAQAAE